MRLIKFDLSNTFLFLGLLALPIAGLMLHNRLHSAITYLPYILYFDIIIISLLYLFDETRFIGFLLNSVFFAVGVVMHLTYVEGGGLSDILISIPDFAMGYALWVWNNKSIESLNPFSNKPKPIIEKQKPVIQNKKNSKKIK